MSMKSVSFVRAANAFLNTKEHWTDNFAFEETKIEKKTNMECDNEK